MRKPVLVAAAVITIGVAPAFAEDACEGCTADDGRPRFTFGASVSYVFDINEPHPSDANENALAYAHQENEDEAFNIDLVQLGISGSRGRASYLAKIDFGDLARYAGDADDGDIGLQEAYISYDAAPVLITAGRFPTPMGYEVLEPWGNANISRSRAWTQFMPISHDGLRLSGLAGDVAMTLGVVNSTYVRDQALAFGANDANDDKGVVGSIGLILGDAAISVAGLYSPEDIENFAKDDQSIINVIVSGPIGDAHAALEGNWARDDAEFSGGQDEKFDFWNVVAYLGFDVWNTGIDLRADYGRTDLPGIPATEDDSNVAVWSITGTLSWQLVDGVELRAEYRHEDFATDFFADDDAEFATDKQDVVQAQLVWSPEL